MSGIFGNYPLEEFKTQDKITYLNAVVHVAAADGFAESEKIVFKLLCAQLQIDNNTVEDLLLNNSFNIENYKNSELMSVFAPYLIRDCVAVSYGDFEFSDEERNAIMSIGEALAIDQKKITFIINAVIGQMNAVKLWSKVININE